MKTPLEPVLSRRLQLIGDMAGRGKTVADVGTDHGLLPISLIENGAFRNAVLSDVRPGPLAAAKRNVKRFCGSDIDCFDFRLGSGLTVLKPGEADVITVCGMGGILISQLLEEGREAAGRADRLILQPNTCFSELRKYLIQTGFSIIEEKALVEEGHAYPVLSVIPLDSRENVTYSEIDYYLGKFIPEKKDPDSLAFLAAMRKKSELILKGMKRGSVSEDTPRALFHREVLKALEEIPGAEEYDKQ